MIQRAAVTRLQIITPRIAKKSEPGIDLFDVTRLGHDAKVCNKYSQMKLQMKREALRKLNRKANEGQASFVTEKVNWMGLSRIATVGASLGRFGQPGQYRKSNKWFRMNEALTVGA